ncbi:CGNR zinc finger domain-containing protein [Streptomyces sp. NPDC047108]|uniref:CGNR zinc finger domain-containing protein n=1 Tax=Streptomyces sp. NPDC047108 TaxID=3155025 RepID=UPI003411DD93
MREGEAAGAAALGAGTAGAEGVKAAEHWDERARPMIGGHPAVDLVNTVSWRLVPDRRTDHLGDASALISWAEAAGLAGPADVRALRTSVAADGDEAEAALRRIRRMREVVHGLLDAAAHDRDPADAGVRAFHRLSLDARRHSAWSTTLPLSWADPPSTVTGLYRRLTLLAEELLSGEQVRGVRLCEGPGCGWLFLDRTRSHTRRWCSSGDCGNRDRARRHYARTKRVAPSGASRKRSRGTG